MKEVFELEKEFGAFYTGGKVAWSSDASKLYCQDGAKINTVEIMSLSITNSFGNQVDEEVLDDQIYTFDLSPKNDFLVSAHKSGLLKLWRTSDFKIIKIWKSLHQGPILQIQFNDSQSLVASAGIDGVVKLWKSELHVCVASLRGCHGVISALKFSKSSVESEYIIACGDDYIINAYDTRNGSMKKQFKNHCSTVTDFAFTLDNQFMISSGRDKVLNLWNFEKCIHIRTIPVYERVESLYVLSFSSPFLSNVKDAKDGIYVLYGGEEGNIKIWDVKNCKIIYKQENMVEISDRANSKQSINNIIYNEILSKVAIVTVDHNISIYDAETFTCQKHLTGFNDEILDLILVGSKDEYLVMATNSMDIKVFDRKSMNCKLLKGHMDIVLALSGHKSWFISSGKDCSVKVWKVHPTNFEFTCMATGTRHTAAIGAIDLSKECAFFVSGSQDKCIKMWKLIKEKTNSENYHLQCTNSQLAHEKDINSIKISPNNKFVATGSQDKTAKLWDTQTFQLIHVFHGHRRGIWTVQFSPVDQILLSTSADFTIRLWSLSDATCLKTFESHESSVLKANFITEGMQIVSTGADGLIKCWNIKSSECVQTLDKHLSRIWALAISSDESFFYTGGADSILSLWKDVTAEKKCQQISRMQEAILEDQNLANLINQKKMFKALKLALKIDRPATSLKILNNIIKQNEAGLEEAISNLSDSCKEALFKHAVNWNTNGRNTIAAQIVINSLLSDILIQKFDVKGLKSIIEETLPYTERHFKRLSQYYKEIQILNYTLKCTQPHIDIKIEEETD
uniref:CSON000914 protein n=1 Tax=Culicoides sonorensis TaxID=179676 RepID=A0A336LQ95_CULSO